MARPGTEDRPLRVAIVGAGPAGIYAADVLMKSDTPVSIDLYERQPAPFGLIRYGVAPDHPRIKGIVKALHQVLSKPEIRLLEALTACRLPVTGDEGYKKAEVTGGGVALDEIDPVTLEKLRALGYTQ